MVVTDVLEQAELEAMLASIPRDHPTGARNYALIQLMSQTGIRCGEALQVEERDIVEETWGNNGDRIKVTVLRLRKNTTKGKKVRQGIPLTRDTLAALAEWKQHRDRLGIKGGPLFCTITKGERMAHFAVDATLVPGEPLSGRYVRGMVKRVAEKAGIQKRVHPHMLRHTALTDLYDKTRDLRLVQVVAGHSSSKTTERYTHVHPVAVAEAMGILS